VTDDRRKPCDKGLGESPAKNSAFSTVGSSRQQDQTPAAIAKDSAACDSIKPDFVESMGFKPKIDGVHLP